MARRRTAQKPSPGLAERLRGLRGWKRVVLFAAIAIGILSVLGLSGGAVYGIQLENQDSFCASCHTQPEAKYYQQSTTAPATTLAAFHTQKQARCIDCHSGGGPFGRMAGLTQGSIDLLAYQSGNYRAPAVTLTKLGDDSCIKCHSDTVTRGGFNNHFHLYLRQWQASDSTAAHCIDCHVAHPTGDPKQQFVQNTAQAVCNQCHRSLGR